ncbi:CHASE3 domain-containing protein [Kordia algicida OT-1]|uniref:histidine kinase n=1 Tax=Kordia algicida OT-1 TaxID=391587 RepID=A9E8E9_9FLAO|nr:CHASE3 domain-containing protein [Kordia algicida]EDP94770.1 probable sensor protein (histidine protein kinase), acting on arcA [Kordia algicida OT-1]
MPLKTIYKAPWFVKAVFIVSFFLIFFVAGITFKNMNSLSDSSDLVTEKYELAIKLEQILSYLKDAETGQRGFMVTRDSTYLTPYISGRENINDRFVEIKELIIDESKQHKNLIELGFLIDNCLDNLEQTQRFILKDQNNFDSPTFERLFNRGKRIMDQIRGKIKVMIDFQNERLEKHQATYESSLKVTPIFLYSLMLMSLLLLIGGYAKIMSNLKKLERTNRSLELFKESTNQSEIVSKHGTWTWDIDDDNFKFSDNLYRLLGEEPHSFEPTIENFMKFVHPEDVETLSEQIAKMQKEYDLPFVYYRVIHENGNVKHLKAYGKAIVSSNGKRTLLGTTTDITDETRSFRALEERNLELERNNKELSAFNHVASHDLQEPLRKIQTFLSRLEEKEEGNLSKSGEMYMSRMKNAATRMRLLIDDLLQFSRTNKADKVLEVSNINLLLEAAKQDLAEVITQKNATVKADTFPVMKVIPFQIQQLFANLIGNSLKYIADDRNPEVTITCEQVNADDEEKLINVKYDAYYKITFKDNGIGFDNEYADRIFVLFSRLHNKDEYSGTGIGLSICKKIVENHLGYIFADGKPGVGATFTVYLPID